MDSGNSGSMQSSSGGDEEYDSRPESIPGFLNPPPTHFGASDSNPEPSLLSHFQNHPPSAGFFDLSSNYFQALSQSQPNSNPNFLLNLDTVNRSRAQRSEPNSCTELGNLAGPSSSTLSMLASQGPGPGPGLGLGPGPDPSVIQLRSVNNEAAAGPRGPPHNNNNSNNNNNNNNNFNTNTNTNTNTNNTGRNSKKRTRASRRAPTTVLTTDTSNFRAMVQEFTGIPAPPFSGCSYSRRLDLFGRGGGGGSSMRSMDTLGPLYTLRPSPQKVHQQSPFLSSSSPSIIEAASNNNFLSSSSNYQQPQPPSSSSDHQGLPKHQYHHVLNPTNLPFQIQSHHHHPLHNVPSFGTRPPTLSMEELDMSGPGYINRVDADHHGNSPRPVTNTSCKLNYAAASSPEFHTEKGILEMNVNSARGEAATLDSWICPSD